jgi:hypothetical protein
MRQVTVQDQLRVTQRRNRNMTLLKEVSQLLGSRIGELGHVVNRDRRELPQAGRGRQSDRLLASAGSHCWEVWKLGLRFLYGKLNC